MGKRELKYGRIQDGFIVLAFKSCKIIIENFNESYKKIDIRQARPLL